MTTEPTAPFIACEPGDNSIFATANEMASYVEVYDIPILEFFDAEGRRLTATADGYRVVLHFDPEREPEPERLASLLQSFFSRLSRHHSDYTHAAQGLQNLDDLVRLRWKLNLEPRRTRLRRVIQRLRK